MPFHWPPSECQYLSPSSVIIMACFRFAGNGTNYHMIINCGRELTWYTVLSPSTDWFHSSDVVLNTCHSCVGMSKGTWHLLLGRYCRGDNCWRYLMRLRYNVFWVLLPNQNKIAKKILQHRKHSGYLYTLIHFAS